MTDPATYLSNLVSKKGKSDLVGCYLTQVLVSADANEDYCYDVGQRICIDSVTKTSGAEASAWNHFLVQCRLEDNSLSQSFVIDLDESVAIFQVITEGNDISALVHMSKVDVDEFPLWVMLFQELLQFVAHFAGKFPTTVRFSIGLALMSWDDMVERGDALERDVAF